MSLNFEPVDLRDQDRYLDRLATCPVKASDYSFVNLWAWGEEYGLEWSWTSELVWIRQTQPQTAYWAPIGPWPEIDWPNAFAAFDAASIPLIRVPEPLAEQWRETPSFEAEMTEARGQWDYLYNRQDLVALKGNRYHKKKNLLNQFKRKYDYQYLSYGPEMIANAKAMQIDWCKWRDCEAYDMLAAENRAIEKLLDASEEFKTLTGGALMVDQVIVAYTIAEVIGPHDILIHFEKADPEFKGSYQAINQMFLAQMDGEYRRVNREQDLGDAGLRKAKLSYNPSDFLRKYAVSVKPGGKS